MNRRTNLKTLLLISASLLAMAGLAQGRTITVGTGPGYDFNTIQAAIDDSNDGDTILVADGTYRGDGNRDIDFLGKAIMVRSENGPENCIIDCNGTEDDPHRGFYFHNGEDTNSVLAGVTITNGLLYRSYPGVGAGILCWGASPTITNCVINKNAPIGIAIWDDNASPNILNCIIKENGAMYGGGIWCYESLPTIMNCVITENEGANGCGGIYCRESSPAIVNTVITGNVAGDGDIGAVCVYDDSNVRLTNCTIVGNAAYTEIGAVLISRNSSATIGNCIIWGNDGQQIVTRVSGEVTVSYSDIEGGYEGIGNINDDPRFVDPGHWTGCFLAGGTWIDGDYHLQSAAGRWDANEGRWTKDDVTSPCIDAGNPGCPLGDEPNDVNNIRINIGAYGGTAEASKSPANWRNIADLTNDWIVDFNDLKVFVDYWLETGQCIPSDLNRSQSVDFSDFAIFGQQWSDTLAAEAGIGKD